MTFAINIETKYRIPVIGNNTKSKNHKETGNNRRNTNQKEECKNTIYREQYKNLTYSEQ